ncbi:MAG: hypothetical protein Q4A05_00230 [Ruminococcus sp.]|nr:hypothetical protein [Ruminococcus sp.]
MKGIFRKLAALSLTAVTILAGCGAYEENIEKPQEPTYSTLQIFTDPVTTQTSTTAATTATTKPTTARQTTVSAKKTTTVKTTTKAAKTTARTTTKAAKTTAATTTAPTTAAANGDYVEYRFRSKKLLEQHFEKHGGEFGDDFGYSNASEYEQGASDVINDPDALHKTEKEDGDYVYYIEATNEFVVLSTDGYIRTYFRPDQGKKYYDKQ